MWGDLFVPKSLKDRPRAELLEGLDARRLFVDDLYGELTDDVFERSTMGTLLSETESEILTTLYLPQLIRYTQLAPEEMRRAGAEVFVKVGTAGTGGMGLNIPFTHSEERPSHVLLPRPELPARRHAFCI